MSSEYYHDRKTYKKKDYLELLKKKQSGKLVGKEWVKLENYQDIFYSVLAWETRDEIFDLLDQFINKQIDVYKFAFLFEERDQLTLEALEILEKNLIILSSNEKAVDFANHLEKIEEYCELTSDENFGLAQFRKFIKKVYSEIEKFRTE